MTARVKTTPRRPRSWVSAGLLVASVLLAACGSMSESTTTTTTPSEHRGLHALDVGLVRLWAPGQGSHPWYVLPVGRQCDPGNDYTIYVSSRAPILGCPPNKTLMEAPDSVWIQTVKNPGTFVRNPATSDLPGWRGDAIRIPVPRLGVILYGFGFAAMQVAESYQTSGLYQLLHASLPVPYPSSWRTIDYGPLSVSVPQSWSVRNLSGVADRATNPGTCGEPVFPLAAGRPSVWLGYSRVIVYCPAILAMEGLTFRSEPGFGLWLENTYVRRPGQTPFSPILFPVQGVPYGTRIIHQHGLTLYLLLPERAAPDGAIEFIVTHGRTTVRGVVGLAGSSPLAEQILSSIRPH